MMESILPGDSIPTRMSSVCLTMPPSDLKPQAPACLAFCQAFRPSSWTQNTHPRSAGRQNHALPCYLVPLSLFLPSGTIQAAAALPWCRWSRAAQTFKVTRHCEPTSVLVQSRRKPMHVLDFVHSYLHHVAFFRCLLDSWQGAKAANTISARSTQPQAMVGLPSRKACGPSIPTPGYVLRFSRHHSLAWPLLQWMWVWLYGT